MQHVRDRSPKHIAHLIHEMGTQCLDDCVACHARTAYSLLMRTVKILEPIAMRRRPSCRAAGACAPTGLPLIDGEPPYVDRCECFVNREFAYEVLHIAGQLEVLLKRGDRLAKMLEASTAPKDKSPGQSISR
jgi:hypothetical protein